MLVGTYTKLAEDWTDPDWYTNLAAKWLIKTMLRNAMYSTPPLGRVYFIKISEIFSKNYQKYLKIHRIYIQIYTESLQSSVVFLFCFFRT